MKKRLLFFVTMLVAGIFLCQLKAQSIGSSDVTSSITNADFSSTTGWTKDCSAQFNDIGNGLIGSYRVRTDVGTAAATDDTHLSSEYCFGFEARWSTNFASYYQSVNLQPGAYVLSYDVTNTNGNTSNQSYDNRFYVQVGSSTIYDSSTEWMRGASGWTTHSISFSLSVASSVKICLGYGTGNNNTPHTNTPLLYVSHLKLDYQDPTLSSKLTELKGVVKKAKALNTVLNISELATLITTVEGKTYSTTAEMQPDINAIKAYYENLETVTITNGDFDTGINIALDGTNSASFIDPATSAKPYIYPVSGWTQNFVFSSTAAQGNTAVYGATVTGEKGTNGTNPPVADMFGNNAGGALHLSAGWSDQARYKQDLANLHVGKYIIYYEANNQNATNNNITSNYFGVGDIEKGNLSGSNNTFIFSELKTYPYNEWVASATGFDLLSPEDAATMHVGLTSTTGGSANGAKLWIDNVTLYYLGWDSSETLTTLQALVDLADAQLAKQMHEDYKAPLVDANNTAKALIQSESDDYEAIAAAQSALQTAVTNAAPSVALYEQIGARLTALQGQLGSIPVADFQAAEVYQNYVNGTVNNVADPTTGTYTSVDDIVPLFKAFVADYWANNTPSENDNLTAFIVNNGFEFGDLTNWTLPNGASGGDGSIVVENANHGPASASEGTKYFYTFWTGVPIQQEINNLPNGTYRLTATIASNDTSDPHKIFIFANNLNAGVDVPAQSETTWQSPVSLDFVVLNGTATIGAVGGKQDNTFDINAPWLFYSADNFILTYISDDFLVAPELPEGQMNAQVKEDMLAAEAAFEADKSHENYDALIAAIDAANASINLYNQIFIYTNAFTLESQRGDIADADARAMAFFTKYSDGEVNGVADPTTGSYTTLEEVTAEYTANVKNYWSNTGITTNSDITALVINNGFETRDVTGWNVNYGNDTGAKENSNPTYTIDIANGDYVFNTWSSDANTFLWLVQTITDLPDGLYEVKAIVASENNINVEFTANEVTDASTHSDKAVGEERTINVVVSDGKLDVGAHANGFFKADYFRVKYLGEEVPVSMKPEIPSGPMNKDVLAALNAADAAFDAAGGNTATNYNALVEAIDAANASIAIYQVINTRIPYLDAQKGTVNIDELTTKYNAGDYVNADDVIYAYHALVVDQIGNNPADGTDMTPYIINPMPNFESEFWWNISKPNGGNGPMKGTEEFEYWIGTAADGNFNYSQWIADLPNGTYEVSAEMYNSLNNQEGTFSPAVAVYGSTPSGEQTALVDVEGETFNTYTATKIIVSDGTITIGAKNVNPMTARWTVFKNFRLKFISKDVPAEMVSEINNEIAGIDTSKPMNRTEKEDYLAAKAAWDVDPSPANYAKVKAAAEVAKKSIASYEIAAADFHEVLNATTKTNIYTYDAYNKYMAQYHRYYEQYELGGLSDTEAATIKYVFFGNRTWHQPGLPIVQLLGSAWDDRGDDTWNDEIIVDYKPLVREAGNGNNYWINTWSGEGDNDGTNFIVPFMEYWVVDTEILADDVFTATVAAATGTRYNVTGVLRARVAGGAEPTGITMQIISEEQVDATLTPTWERVGDSEYYIANVSITGSTDVIDNNQDGLNDLHIQFVVNETNANWFSFKDLFAQRETPLDAATVEAFVNQMTQAVADVANYPLGFEEGEYAPYNNAKKLKAAEICQNFIEQITEAGQSGGSIPNYMMMQQAYSALANSGEWVKNTCEQNAFYWTTNYSADDVEVITWYNEDGTISQRWDGYVNQFRTCYPVGWTLGDRADAYNSRIIKYGVDDNNMGSASEQGTMPGLKSAADGTVLFTKQDTHYGEETGYTLPLKANKTYYLSFVYADHDEAKMPTTNIIIHRKGNAAQVVNNLTYPSFAPIAVQGNYNQDRWYYYRGTFTVPETGDYVIEFNKERNDGRTWGEQRQTAIGDLVLVLAPENDDMADAIAIDGQCTDFNAADQTPAYDFNPAEVTLTRAFNGNGETGTWNTIMVPFNLDWAETKENFGIEEIAYYIGTEDTDIGIKLLFETRRTGLKANQPVMVFYKADNEKLNLDNAKMKTRTALASNNAEDQFGFTYKPVVIGHSTNDGIEKDNESRFVIYDPNGKFDFVGTYQTLHIPYYGVYINASNQWRQSTGKTGLQPTRAYFREVAGDGTSTAKLLGFSIDEVPTGIIAIEEDGEMHVTSGNIYTLDGRLVRQNATSLEGLQPGVYVVDGKKYIIK